MTRLEGPILGVAIALAPAFATPQSPPESLSEAEVEALLDANHVPGVSIAVIQDFEILVEGIRARRRRIALPS